MERNSPINSVYLIALSIAPLCLVSNSLFDAIIFSIVILAAFLISLSIVSMIDKITDNHVRYIMFAFISAAIVTIFRVISDYVNLKEVIALSQHIEIAITACLILGIYPIYFENTFAPTKYVKSIILIAIGEFLMLVCFSSLTEILGYGTIAGISIGLKPLEFFTKSYGAFMLLATLAVLFNMVRRAYIKKTKRFETLVEKYKIIIKDIRENHEEVDYTKVSGKGGKS